MNRVNLLKFFYAYTSKINFMEVFYMKGIIFNLNNNIKNIDGYNKSDKIKKGKYYGTTNYRDYSR